MNKKIIISVIILVILVVAGFFWWQSGQKTGEEDIANKESLKIAVNVWPGYAHIFIAKEKGFFEKNGVNVELILKKDYSEAQQLYINGEVDGILEVFSDTILHNIKNQPTKVVYVADYSDEGDVIIGKSEFGFLAELKGKKVSIEGFNSFSHLFVSTALEQSGIRASEVTFVDILAFDVLDALEAGEIDAGHTWEPIKSAALAKGYKQLSKAGDFPGLITDVLAFNSEIIEKRTDDIQAVVQSMLEARAFLESNKQEAIAIMAQAEGMSEAEMEEGILGVHLLDKRDNQTAFSYAAGLESLHGVARIINNFMRENGITDKQLDSIEFIDARFIRALK